MIIPMPISARPQQRYDHRLRNLVHRSGDVTVATDLRVSRPTARGWLRAAKTVVVCLDVADLTEPELRQEILMLRRRVQKLTALLRLVQALLRHHGCVRRCSMLKRVLCHTQRRSKRSRFITLAHAFAKSRTNLSFPSASA
jgi:hypothetical protein